MEQEEKVLEEKENIEVETDNENIEEVLEEDNNEPFLTSADFKDTLKAVKACYLAKRLVKYGLFKMDLGVTDINLDDYECIQVGKSYKNYDLYMRDGVMYYIGAEINEETGEQASYTVLTLEDVTSDELDDLENFKKAKRNKKLANILFFVTCFISLALVGSAIGLLIYLIKNDAKFIDVLSYLLQLNVLTGIVLCAIALVYLDKKRK